MTTTKKLEKRHMHSKEEEMERCAGCDENVPRSTMDVMPECECLLCERCSPGKGCICPLCEEDQSEEDQSEEDQ